MIDEVITPTRVGYTGGRGKPSGNAVPASRGGNRRPQPIDEDMIAPSTAKPTGGRGGPPSSRRPQAIDEDMIAPSSVKPTGGRGGPPNRRPQAMVEDMIAPSTVKPTGGRGGPPGTMANAVMEQADDVFAPSKPSGRRKQSPKTVDEVIEPTNVNSPRRRGKPAQEPVNEEIVPSRVNPTGVRGGGKPQRLVSEEIVPVRVNPESRRERAPKTVDEVIIPTNVVPSGRRSRPPPPTDNDYDYPNDVAPTGRSGRPPKIVDDDREQTAGRQGGRPNQGDDRRRKPAEVNGSNHPRMPNGNGTTTTSETRRVIQSEPSVQTYQKTTRHVTYRTATTVEESEESESEYTEEEASPPGTPDWKRKVNWNLGPPPPHAQSPTSPPEDENPDEITEGTRHVEITGNRVITTTRKVRKVKKEVPEPAQPNGPLWSSSVQWSSQTKKKPPPVQIKQEQRLQVSPPQMVPAPAPLSPRIIVAEGTLPRPQYIQQPMPLQIQTIQPQPVQQMPVASQPQQLYILQTQPTGTIDGGMRTLTLPRGQTQQAYILPADAFLGTQTLPGRGQQIRILDGGSSYRVDSGSSLEEVDRSVQNLQQSIHELHGVNTMRSTRSRYTSATSASGYDTHLRPSAYSEVSTFRHRSVSQSSIDGKSDRSMNATICVSCKRPFGPHDKMGTYRGSPCHETCMPNSPTEKPASTCVACHIKFHPDDKMVLLNGKTCHEMCLPKVTDEQNTSIRKVRTMSSRSPEPSTPTSPSVSVRKVEMGTSQMSQSRMQYMPPPTPGTPGSAMSTSTHYTWGGEVTPHTPFSMSSNTSGFTMEMVRPTRQVEGEDVFMCFYCNKPIRGQVVGAFNKVFHEGHFACCCCHRRFKRGQKFYELDNRPMCKKCCRAFPGNEVDSKWGFTMGRR
ncbi:LIMS1 [Branchiostoma lanceolatum]|uniref:LIMS1 protein n=1 Tax=Branchiostoma lanceolatum TaxID=7740 RepID=A0A8J9Z0T9_BRALA|nr:LIMS1 [Branchiostoma lanceolatum]